MNILIVGHGFVGQAVDYGFEHPSVTKTIVDPKYARELHDIDHDCFDFIFICVPTPMGAGGRVDDSILTKVMARLEDTDAITIIKSTITPDIVSKYKRNNVVYNPEFLTEKNANEQFINPQFHVFGGESDACSNVADLYRNNSNVYPSPAHVMSLEEASFVKYTINTFLAMKVTFFNQLYDVVNTTDANFAKIANVVGQDNRIGLSHTRVPGFDGKQGFGGACFPKDTTAFFDYSSKLTLLEECIRINNEYRSCYELDEREKEQNIEYNGQTQKEQ